MLSLSAVKPLNRWAYDRMQPGAVGSVGDVNIEQRLKSSLPGEFRWEKMTHGKNAPGFGANVTDGMSTSYSTGAGPARTKDGFIGGNRDTRTARGWRIENLKPEDRAEEPTMAEMPQLSWRMNVASVKNQQRTGNLFKTPSGINPATGIPRGGQVPTVVAATMGTTPIGNFTGALEQSLAFGGGYRDTETRDVGVGGGFGGKRVGRGNDVLGRMRA